MFFEIRSTVDFPIEKVWLFHSDVAALEVLNPPGGKAKIIGEETAVRENALHEIEFQVGPFKTIWHARIHSVDPPYQFIDKMEKGPFHSWEHSHEFYPVDANRTQIVDKVNCNLKPGLPNFFWSKLGFLALIPFFVFRHRATKKALKTFEPTSEPRSTHLR